jgi:hypothetical protein
LLIFAFATPVFAKPHTRPKPAPTAPSAPTEASPAKVTPEGPKAAVPDADTPSAVLLERAQALYASLEYDKVIPLTEALLQRSDLLMEQKLEAHRLNGSAKAIVQDPADAEKPFRLLLRTRPNYDLPGDTPPKILAVFRKVQAEEKALAEQADAFQRDAVVKNLKVLDEPATSAPGGQPLKFSLRLHDPGSVVESVKVPYRRSGQGEFSVLALQRDEEGKWRGQIPADFTVDPNGFALEYYVETADQKGTLLSDGTARAPLRIDVAAGKLQGAPKPLHRGILIGGFALAAACGITWAGLYSGFRSTQDQYNGLKGEVPGATTVSLSGRGNSLALASNIVGFGALGIALLTALLIPFVDFDGPQQ